MNKELSHDISGRGNSVQKYEGMKTVYWATINYTSGEWKLQIRCLKSRWSPDDTTLRDCNICREGINRY